MRLIGNKTKLLGNIEELVTQRGIEGGTFIDIFSGTASVARHFKRLGFRVLANDHLSVCYTQAVAGVEVRRYPEFRGFRQRYSDTLESRAFQESFGGWSRRLGRQPAAAQPLAEAVHFLNCFVEPQKGLVFRSFSAGGTAGRRYLTPENGARVDAALEFLRRHYRDEVISHEELHLLLSSLIDATDRVANISGTYGAFLKNWQPNARRRLELELPQVMESPLEHRAYREDANALVRKLRGDVLYIDPPYNHRQYAANYHVLDILAEHHRVEDLEAYEASLYGKTGLRPYANLKSDYCVRPESRFAARGNVLAAMSDLVLSSKVRHVVVSYNEEGLLSREEIGSVLARFAGKRKFNFDEDVEEILYQRFRSDHDREVGHEKGSRTYRTLEGRGRNEIGEWLFFATRPRRRTDSRTRPRGAPKTPSESK